MCLLMTAFAAVVTTIVWYFRARNERIKLGTLALMYWGAALMWSVDGFFSLAGGEPFFDASADDALLGAVIVLSGLIAWTAMLLWSDPEKAFARTLRNGDR